jgi:hypothetical protein
MFWKISPQGLSLGESKYITIGQGEELKGRSTFALVLILVASILLPLINIPKSNAADPKVCLSLDPFMYIAHAKGETFTVNIEITNVANLSSYQFTVTHNASLLKVNQVLQGPFIPPSLPSHFSFQTNMSTGILKINCSINNPNNAVTGSGSLASIIFEVIHNPNWCANGPIRLIQTTLLNAKGISIVHDVVGAVYFYKTLEPDPPVEGRVLDVYTQKGGIGQGQHDGNFTLGEEVQLTSNVTYNGFPVQQKLVAFQVQNPLGISVVLRTAITDQNGQASISFKIPNVLDSIGTWWVISVVEIAEEIAWDIVTFDVVTATPVGGYSTATKGLPETGSYASYQIIVAALSVFLVTTRFRKRRNQPQAIATSSF